MLISLFLLLACETSTTTTTINCTLPRPTLEPAAAGVGEQVTATTGPLYTDWDTAVLVGSTRARVLKVTRDTCTDCDTCRAESGCTACGECDACADTCSLCIESVTFETPNLSSGSYEVSILGQYGSSELAHFEVLVSDSSQDSTP